MTKTFRTKEWREHKKTMILNREKANLPAMQRYASALKSMEELKIKVTEKNKTHDTLGVDKNKIDSKIHSIQSLFIYNRIEPDKMEEQNNLVESLFNEKNDLAKKIFFQNIELQQMNNEYQNQIEIYHDLNGKQKEKKEFILKCVKEGCRGFLSQSYKCELCATYICKDCMIPKSEKNDDNHVCKKEDVDTVTEIRKNTRPCPKCGIRISKIDGCFAENTPILLWNGETKMSQEIIIGDVLIGDDGMPRSVTHLCSGEDKLYEITQNKGIKYTVNSKHKLILKYSGDSKIYWSENENAWKMSWFDNSSYIIKHKKVEITNELNKEEAYKTIEKFKQSLNNLNVIEITIDDYMKLSDSKKKSLMGFKSEGINWEKKDVPLDPYIMGVWLGDGINDGISFALSPETDPEIITYIIDWCDRNNCELVHDDMYRFRVRRISNNRDRFAIGHGATSENCKACIKKKCSFCDLPTKEINIDKKNKKNPLKEIFDSYNLTRNKKYIPNDYLINDRETRLKLLAGIVDTDGHVTNNGKRIQIPQANHNLAKQIELLSKSLGFITNINITKKRNIKFNNSEPKDYPDHLTVNISGENLHEIPTKVQRKKCIDSNSNKDQLRTNIKVKEVGNGKYYGWSITDNKRFILTDFTVVRNCDQMFCVAEDCHTAFSWNTGQIVNGLIHNPHYYEWVRRNNNGVVPRNPGDNPCGNDGRVQYYDLHRAVNNLSVSSHYRNLFGRIHQCIMDFQEYRVNMYPQIREANMFKELHCEFLLNRITEEKWRQSMFLRENNFEKKQQIGMILRTFVTIGNDTMMKLYQEVLLLNTKHKSDINKGRTTPDIQKEYIKFCIKYEDEFNKIRDYVNDSLISLGQTMMCAVPQISNEWYWVAITKVEKILEERTKSKSTSKSS